MYASVYFRIHKLKTYFGEKLTQINYVPVSGDLEFIINGETYFLSNILLALSVGMEAVKIE